MDAIIKDEHDKIRSRLRAGAKDPEVLLSVKNRLQEIGGELRQVYADNGYTNYLVAYLKREHEKYLLHHGRGPDTHDYDETRPEPTCHCEAMDCPVGRGQLPVSIRTADNLERAIRQYTHEHTANPVALHEARDAWSEKCARLESELATMNIALAQNVTLEDLESGVAFEHDDEETDEADDADAEADESETTAHDPTEVTV